MSFNCSLADACTKIRNAQKAFHATVELRKTKLIVAVLEVMKKEGYIKDYTVEDKISVTLKYYEQQQKPVIHSMKMVSKPSHPVYISREDIRLVKQGFGIAIITTSQGVMSDKKAAHLNIGGKVLVFVR